MKKFENKFALSIFLFGLMEMSIGLSIFLLPELNTKILGLADGSTDVFRMCGILGMAFGYYYIRFGLNEDENFARYSVHVRIGLTIAWVALISASVLPIAFVTLAVYDLAGALWTVKALKEKSEQIIS